MCFAEEVRNHVTSVREGNAEAIAENGPDPHCPDWKPALEATLPSIQAIPEPSDSFRNLAKTLRAHMLERILGYFFGSLLGRRRHLQIMSCLFDPSQYEEMEAVCYFRKHLIWPMFGSTRDFHDFLLQFVPAAMEHYAFFPTDHPAMNIDEIIEYFERQGDEQSAQLAKLEKKLFGNHKSDRLDFFSTSANMLYNFRLEGYY